MFEDSSYLIVGDGRMARHLEHYFTLLNLRTKTWSRKQDPLTVLESLVKTSEFVLLLISDSAIERFIDENPILKDRTLIHFSGALATTKAVGMHPLNTFGPELYDLDVYQRTAFICDEGDLQFQDVFPKLRNPHFTLSRELRPLYHSLCVMAGNFTTLLWQKAYADFENKLQLPADVLIPYLEQITANLHHPKRNSLTGPLVRNDKVTIDKNLEALTADPFREVYSAFVSAFTGKTKSEII